MKKYPVFRFINLFFSILFCYLAVRLLGIDGNTKYIHLMMVVLLGGIGVWFCLQDEEDGAERAFQAFVAAGMVLHIGYMLSTGCMIRSHDLGDFTISSGGHASYLLTLIRQGQLPQTNEIQFYQQPFFYLAGSAVSVVVNHILHCEEAFYLVDAAKIISCFASCAVLLCLKPLCGICGVKGRGRVIAAAMTAFLPASYLAGGRVNCDALVYFFMTVLFLQTLRFREKPDWKNILLLALAYGLAMMTKISCGLMALFTTVIFLYEFGKRIRHGGWLSLGLKYLTFALISFPLGLWYSMRNYFRFAQSLTYVLQLTSDSPLYRGEVPLVQRFFTLDTANLLKTPYVNIGSDYNLPVYLLKSALFGEFYYSVPVIVPVLLLLCGMGLSVVTVVAVYDGIRKKKMAGAWKYMIGVFCLSLLAAFYFYWREPYSCSMDYRYSIFMIVPAGMMAGRLYEEGGNVVMKKSISCLAAGFVLCSVLFCLMVR